MSDPMTMRLGFATLPVVVENMAEYCDSHTFHGNRFASLIHSLLQSSCIPHEALNWKKLSCRCSDSVDLYTVFAPKCKPLSQ